MKKTIFVINVLLAFFLFDKGYCELSNNKTQQPIINKCNKSKSYIASNSCCNKCEPCCKETPKTNQPCDCAYNAPARIDPACGMKSWRYVSFIYWQAMEKGLEVCNHFTREITDKIHYNGDMKNLNFEYHPGFKVGAGISILKDDWALLLEYTRLNGADPQTEGITNFST